MKRTTFRPTGVHLPVSFVRSAFNPPRNSAQTFSKDDAGGASNRKITIVRKVQRMPSANGPGRKIRHILVFDHHPDTLQLVFGQRVAPLIDSTEASRTSLWQFVLVAALTFTAVFGMFWPLFK